MSAALQIAGLMLGTFGVAAIVYSLLGLVCALGVVLIGIGLVVYLVGAAIERADEVNGDEIQAFYD